MSDRDAIDSARPFFESLEAGVVLLDEKLVQVWTNTYYRDRIASRLQMCEKHCFTGLAPGESRCEDCLPPQVQRTGRTTDTLRSVRDAGGALHSYRVVLTPLGGPGRGVVVFILPIPVEELPSQQGWRERFLLSAIRNSNDAVFALDRQQTVRFWNRGAEQMFGVAVANMVGHTLHDLFHPEARGEAEEIFHPTDAASLLPGRELRMLGPGRRDLWVEVSRTPLLDGSGLPNGASFVVRDVSERRQALEKMAFTERMNAVGNMAAALAHEIGTPLGVISGNAEVLMLDMDADDPRREDLRVILSETERIGGLVRDLLNFSRPESPEFEPVSAADVFDRVERLVRHAARKQSTALEVEVDAATPRVLGDANQLEQLVLNLTMNALQALERGGRVSLSARPSRGGAEIEVRDTGPGIALAILDRMFHPFVTSKPNGTGLGLAVGKRIVEEHGGSISARNGEEGGAAFLVWLPSTDPEESD